MPRARALIYISLSLRLSTYPNLSTVYSSSYPLDARSQTRRVGDARTASVERTEAKDGLGKSKVGGGCTKWTNIDRTGTGKVRGRQKRAKSTERRRQDDGGSGDGGGMA